MQDLHELLKTTCTVKLVAHIGDGDKEQDAVILNRVVRDADGRGGNGNRT